MQFMASHKSLSKPPWQWRSLDSQEFGFASNLMDSSDVAPADELFFKGQLLPLQMDHRLHLVHALSSSSSSQSLNSYTTSARVGSSRLASSHDLCQEDDVIEFNLCRLERDLSLHYLKESMESTTSEDHKLLNHMQCVQSSKESSSRVARDDKLKRLSTETKGSSELDCSTCAGHRAVADGEEEHCVLSSCEDEELHSCNRDMGTVDYKFSTANDVATDPGSSSFRSQNSGFWDSGTDKDMMDSSSSRDSNGSSQDSYFHSNLTQNKASSFNNTSHHHHHSHSKPMSFNIPWKLALFRRGASKKQAPPQDSSIPFTKGGFSEDLSKYKASAHVPPLNEVKEALLPRKLDMEVDGTKQPENKGKNQRKVCFSAASDGCSANGMKLCESSAHICGDAGMKKSSVRDRTSRSFRLLTKGVEVGEMEDEAAAKKQKSAAAKERWQMCARRLKASYEMKRGWMGQFRMDECGKRAYCEVEHGIILQSSRPAGSGNGQMQRRFSHEASSSNAMKGQKPTSQQQKQRNGHSYKVLAISSCPPSTISSPTHNGVLALLDPNQRINTHSSKSLNLPLKDSAPIPADKGSIKSSGIDVTNYRSISTMQELHSALQSAIAHCKESNNKEA